MATLTTSGSPKAQKPCAGCDKLLNQDNYSGTQWKKGAAKQCKSCMANGAPPKWLKDAEKAKVSFYPCPTPFSPTISPQQSMNKPIVRALSLFVSLFFSFFSLSLFLIFSLLTSRHALSCLTLSAQKSAGPNLSPPPLSYSLSSDSS